MPLLLGIFIPGVFSVMAALALVSGAYLAHGVAAGIRGIGSSQWDAALAMGVTRWGALRHVVLPQALQMMLPSLINQWVTLVKDSSLTYIVGVNELSFLATQVNARIIPLSSPQSALQSRRIESKDGALTTRCMVTIVLHLLKTVAHSKNRFKRRPSPAKPT